MHKNMYMLELANKTIYEELLCEARRMRNSHTKTEQKLWRKLKRKKLRYKFRQQHIIDQFIVDYFCFEKQLIIEIDGEIHDHQKEADKEREIILKSYGFKVLRFSNRQIENNIKTVIKHIISVLDHL